MKLLLAISALAVLSVEPARASDHSVDYYMTNGAARDRTLIQCAKTPAERAQTRECISARAAAQRIKFSHQGVAKVRQPGGKRYTGKTF